MKPLISIIHPSRSRPEMAAKTAKKWLSSAKNRDNIQYIISVDDSDPMLSQYEALPVAIYESTGKWIDLVVACNNNAIEAINEAVSDTKADIFIVVSDDFDCPFHWDIALLSMLEGKEDYLVKTKDGIQKALITLPIMDRKYYERFGYIYNPEYKHMFSDQEMTAVGHMLGRVIELDITFPHNHYTTGKMAKDAINAKNDATWEQGKQVYFRNLQGNFGIDKPVKEYNQIVWH